MKPNRPTLPAPTWHVLKLVTITAFSTCWIASVQLTINFCMHFAIKLPTNYKTLHAFRNKLYRSISTQIGWAECMFVLFAKMTSSLPDQMLDFEQIPTVMVVSCMIWISTGQPLVNRLRILICYQYSMHWLHMHLKNITHTVLLVKKCSPKSIQLLV